MKEKQRFICKTLKSIILKWIFKNSNLFFKSHLNIIKNEEGDGWTLGLRVATATYFPLCLLIET